MKTLVNKNNPALRITVPEIIEEEEYYTWDGEKAFLKENWILVEGIKGNLEGIPSNVDLEKELQAFLCNYDYEFDDDPAPFDIATHFYELGFNARKEE